MKPQRSVNRRILTANDSYTGIGNDLTLLVADTPEVETGSTPAPSHSLHVESL